LGKDKQPTGETKTIITTRTMAAIHGKQSVKQRSYLQKNEKKEQVPTYSNKVLQEIFTSEPAAAYLINSHKAQGSTYHTVYVDYENIMGRKGPPDWLSKLSALYVATSRPTTRLVLVGNGQLEYGSGTTELDANIKIREDLEGVRPTSTESKGETSDTNNPFNIWSTDKKSGKLSNLANRPFTYVLPDDFPQFAGDTYQQMRGVPLPFKSVEHAYQTLKSGEFDKTIYNKAWGKNNKIRGKKARTENDWNINLMDNLIRESLATNSPEAKAALKLLEESVGRPITHVGPYKADPWTIDFPLLLTQIRKELFIDKKETD
ncbi:uncharacterized protein METZ01_LOCUS354509, partial [marine metagenome]